jgi:hypothetical protein
MDKRLLIALLFGCLIYLKINENKKNYLCYCVIALVSVGLLTSGRAIEGFDGMDDPSQQLLTYNNSVIVQIDFVSKDDTTYSESERELLLGTDGTADPSADLIATAGAGGAQPEAGGAQPAGLAYKIKLSDEASALASVDSQTDINTVVNISNITQVTIPAEGIPITEGVDQTITYKYFSSADMNSLPLKDFILLESTLGTVSEGGPRAPGTPDDSTGRFTVGGANDVLETLAEGNIPAPTSTGEDYLIIKVESSTVIRYYIYSVVLVSAGARQCELGEVAGCTSVTCNAPADADLYKINGQPPTSIPFSAVDQTDSYTVSCSDTTANPGASPLIGAACNGGGQYTLTGCSLKCSGNDDASDDVSCAAGSSFKSTSDTIDKPDSPEDQQRECCDLPVDCSTGTTETECNGISTNCEYVTNPSDDDSKICREKCGVLTDETTCTAVDYCEFKEDEEDRQKCQTKEDSDILMYVVGFGLVICVIGGGIFFFRRKKSSEK